MLANVGRILTHSSYGERREVIMKQCHYMYRYNINTKSRLIRVRNWYAQHLDWLCHLTYM